ncbi:Aste57867_8574 [Aphanomyces stellatus]|uniref:Aste57867_8574 protein n=1 Tax=Aphanomyces stellatus TaxID=120398 RepID=A0A485KKR5_9STRA|nr:hypothetical protein As57867_008542 [Aphanomyces stellatus]VFT85460.1 Aste57867_8574 [Aphanomyces stellatus]
MSRRAQFERSAKRGEVNYAVLHTGQLVPDVDSPEKPSKRTKKTAHKPVCYLCNESVAGKLRHCATCTHRFHWVCTKKVLPTATADRCCQCILAARAPAARQSVRPQSLDDAVHALLHAKRIVVLVGAGISVSCGIPDFRSANGIYAMVRDMGLDLPDPQALFDIEYFRANPGPFFHFANDFFRGKTHVPSLTHRFLRLLQDRGQLLRVYSQNIDGLELAAGVTPVIQCHGTLTTSSCMSCKTQVDTASLYRDDVSVATDLIPRCQCGGIFKPDITFFGQRLSDETGASLVVDRQQADLLLVMGTSLQVAPVADIPAFLSAVPQILINMESVKPKGSITFQGFDIECFGKCDSVVAHFVERLGWDLAGYSDVRKEDVHRHEPNRFCFGACRVAPEETTALATSQETAEDAFECDECRAPIAASRFSCTYVVVLSSIAEVLA